MKVKGFVIATYEIQYALWMALFNTFSSMLIELSGFLVTFEGFKAGTCV